METETIQGFKVNSGEARFGEHFEVKDPASILDVKISGSDTNGELAVFEGIGLSPNEGPVLHIHLFQDEAFYIIEGEFLFQLGDEKYELKTGDSIFLPRNVPHTFVQLSQRGKVIVSFQPAGKMEDLFRIMDSLTSPPSDDEFRRICEDHDVKVVGPSLKVD